MTRARRPSRARWLALCTLAALAIAVLAHYVRIAPPERRSLLYNADLLYLPALYEAVAAGTDLAEWRLSTAPYFFPDMALFFAVRAISGDMHRAIALFGIAQAALFVGGMAWLSCRIHRDRRSAALVALLAALFFTLLSRLPFAFSLMLASVFHFGVLVALPYTLLLALDLLDPPARLGPRRVGLAGALLFALVSLCTASDVLYLVQVSAPLAGAALLAPRLGLGWRPALRLWALLVAGTIFGQAINQLLVRFPNPIPTETGWEAALRTVGQLGAMAADLIAPMPLLAPVAAAWLAAALWVAFGALHQGPRLAPSQRPRALVVWALLGGFALNLAVVIATGKPEDRYLLPAIFLPSFFGWPLLVRPPAAPAASSPLWRRLHAAAMPAAAAGLLVANLPAAANLGALAAYGGYYPPWVRCIDEQARRLGVREGIAQYWQARPLTLLSEAGVRAAPVGDRLIPFHWVNSLADFRRSFDFALVDTTTFPPAYRISEPFLRAEFGPPAAVAICDTDRILAYNRPADAVFSVYLRHLPQLLAFDRPGARAELSPALMAGELGENVGLARRAAPDSRGLLVVGPPLLLAPGSYMFRIDYAAAGTGGARPGYWDVLASSAGGRAQVLSSADLPAVGRTVRGVFVLDKPAEVEIRVIYEGRGALTVEALQVERLR